MSVPLHVFRVYPGSKRSYYFQVAIFANRRAMHREAKRWKFRAQLEGFHDKDLNKWIGTLYFCRHDLGSGLVSHEMLHAALWWHRVRYKTGDIHFPQPRRTKRGYRLIADKEEELCCIIESLTKQFWKTVYDRGIVTRAELQSNLGAQ